MLHALLVDGMFAGSHIMLQVFAGTNFWCGLAVPKRNFGEVLRYYLSPSASWKGTSLLPLSILLQVADLDPK